MSQKLIEVHYRDKNISQLAKLFETDYNDFGGWVEEFLNEDELSLDFEDYSQLDELLNEEQLESLCTKVIEHYTKEISIEIVNIINQVKSIKITLKT